MRSPVGPVKMLDTGLAAEFALTIEGKRMDVVPQELRISIAHRVDKIIAQQAIGSVQPRDVNNLTSSSLQSDILVSI